MLKNIFNLILFLTVIIAVTAGSCKKQSADKPAPPFDPEIDGIAVRPLPKMDMEQAQRIKKEGPISTTADSTINMEAPIPSKAPPTVAPTPTTPPEDEDPNDT